jgi:putative nucleotidyltransferase with HDIG domain
MSVALPERDREQLPYALELRVVELARSGRVKIPPYSETARRLDEMIHTNTYTLRDLARLVSSDPSLAAAALRIANTAANGAVVGSIEQAVSRIGSAGVVRLSLGMGMAAMIARPGPLGAARRGVWRRAVMGAELARLLADRRRLPPEEAYACGLLHDLGKPFVVAILETILAAAPAGFRLGLGRCLQVMETYHVELGLVLAAQWNLPPQIERVIASHHAADPAKESPMTRLIMAVDEVLDRFDNLPMLSLEQLNALQHLEPGEAPYVATCLLGLPTVVRDLDPTSFVGTGPIPILSAPPSPMLQRPESALPWPQVPMELPIRCLDGDWGMQSMYLSPGGIGVRSPRPMIEQEITRIGASDRGRPVELWATVALCVPEGQQYRIELRPVAMDARPRAWWTELHKLYPAQPATGVLEDLLG